ncbi:hypothetical protein [Bombiscardovia coagulans]|uniref:Uncharacterized protein n=1 Tax=Bombiscardovia coagulans TaxID=686666 RepID=A0A261EQS6_9BIFI|nr:hypothetical protein [Bombiscardovia coagulans]OZG49208.1 hypothetical protein BOCO_1017 [Bombiscardovia coagulans]
MDQDTVEMGKERVQEFLPIYKFAQERAERKHNQDGSLQPVQSEPESKETDTVTLDSSGDGQREQSERSNKERRTLQDRKDDEEITKLKLENDHLRQQNKLRFLLGGGLIVCVVLQLLISDCVVGAYVLHQSVASERIVLAWMSTSVIELLGIIMVVVRSLFPLNGDRHANSTKKH